MMKIFTALNRKQQQMAIVGLAFILCFLLVLINSFLLNKKEISSLNLSKSEKLFVDVNKSLSYKSKYQNSIKTDASNLSSTVSSLARVFNLTIDKIQPGEDGEIMVSINQTEFVGLYEWLRELELEKGIVVSKASVRINSSRGSVSGVRAQLVLKTI